LSIPNITVVSILKEIKTIDPLVLKKILSANIKARRKKLGISQEKLAEMANLSVQMVNCIEGRRAWVSDKSLLALANALGVEAFQLFVPDTEKQKTNTHALSSRLLMKLRQDMKKDINANVDIYFERLLNMNQKN